MYDVKKKIGAVCTLLEELFLIYFVFELDAEKC